MIKRLLILILALLPVAAFAQNDRDVVLAEDGTLYAVESTFAKDVAGLRTTSERVLTLRVQNGTENSVSVIPATLAGGWHVDPAIAYDSQSRTLFVFWEAAHNNFNTTELLVAAYQNGTWTEPASLDPAHLAARENFRIAITHSSEQIADDGTTTRVPEINIHAVWWEDNGAAEWARYAMITVEKGAVTAIDVRDLSSFGGVLAPDGAPKSDVARELLRHPAVVEKATRDSVDVLFGDSTTVSLRRTNIRPTIQGGRLRVPVGRGGTTISAPSAGTLSVGTPVNAILTADSVAFYFNGRTPNTLSYLLYRNGQWSPLRSIALNEKLSHDVAVSALEKLAAQ